jgi:hypothetical protein
MNPAAIGGCQARQLPAVFAVHLSTVEQRHPDAVKHLPFPHFLGCKFLLGSNWARFLKPMANQEVFGIIWDPVGWDDDAKIMPK